MERIGITASKMAQGRLWLYNLYVVLISFLFSLLIFFVAGSSIVLALIIIGYILNGVVGADMGKDWFRIIRICMIFLTIVVGALNVFAIARNIRWSND